MIGPARAALICDTLFGEPPVRLHPTVWMGRWLTHGRSHRRSLSTGASFLEGMIVLGAGVVGSAFLGTVLDACVERVSDPWRGAVAGAVLKPALSLRPLLDAAHEVRVALERRRLGVARRVLARHLVSRETKDLTASEVAGAAIESVAENLNDSIVAPLVAYRAGGFAAAYAYRMINTADAMLGYRTPELEWFGKAAARADDVAGFLPARCSALLIACAAPVGRGSSREALRVARSDAKLTTSPNAGWPMAAMAGALGVQLQKRGLYALNSSGRPPRAGDIGRACRIVGGASALAAVVVDVV